MTDHATFMRQAIALSRIHMRANAGGPFGAVIVHEGKVIGEGWNKVTSTNDPTAHAEMVAIREACKRLARFDLAGCVLYASCEPCPMCLSAAYWARLDKVYYANEQADAAAINFDDAFLYRQLSLPRERRSLVCEQILRDEALEVFREWDAKPDKVPY